MDRRPNCSTLSRRLAGLRFPSWRLRRAIRQDLAPPVALPFEVSSAAAPFRFLTYPLYRAHPLARAAPSNAPRRSHRQKLTSEPKQHARPQARTFIEIASPSGRRFTVSITQLHELGFQLAYLAIGLEQLVKNSVLPESSCLE